MIASRLTTKISLKRPVVDDDNPFGETLVTYQHARDVYAERKAMSVSEVAQAGEYFADYRATFIVRWAVLVATGWRVVDSDGLEYDVKGVIPNRRRGLRELVCIRVNE